LKEYTAEWEKLKARGLKLKNEAIPAFNKQLWDLGMGAIWQFAVQEHLVIGIYNAKRRILSKEGQKNKELN
jgi:hypothetical protein